MIYLSNRGIIWGGGILKFKKLIEIYYWEGGDNKIKVGLKSLEGQQD